MEIAQSSFNLDDYVSKNGGTPEEIEIVKAYFSLPKDTRQKIFDHFKKHFTGRIYDSVPKTAEELESECPPVENSQTG